MGLPNSPTPTNLKELVEQSLRRYGFDALYTDACACAIEDLMPCGEPSDDCEPGYKIPCDGNSDGGWECEGDCEFHISVVKPNPNDGR